MTKTPKRFDWEIETVAFSLAAPWSGRSSRATVQGWTWRNPPGFGGGYVLKVDALAIDFHLASVVRAVRDRFTHAIAKDRLLSDRRAV